MTLLAGAARGQLFVAGYESGTISEYTTGGSTINASLISGLNGPQKLAVAGDDLFVTSGNTVGEYTISGATVNASLISGLNVPVGLAVVGNDIFVTTGGNTIGEYTTSGTPVNTELILATGGPNSLATEPTPEQTSWILVGLGLAMSVCGRTVPTRSKSLQRNLQRFLQ